MINIMLILFHNFFIKINFYTNNNLFLTLSTGNSYGLSDFYGIRDIIKNIVYVLLFRNEEQLAGATWFLRVIFLINIAYAINSYLINKILKNKKGKNTIYILFLHFLAFKLITYIQLRIYNLPNYSLASFPTLYINNGWWILYFLAGIIIPMIICKTLKYCKERAHEKYSNNK